MRRSYCKIDGTQDHLSESENSKNVHTLLTADEAAGRLRISTRTLARLTARGDVPCVRLGRLVRYRPADLATIGGEA